MRRSAVVGLLALPLLASSCDKPKSAAEQAAEDAKAIAMVEAAQNADPPPVPIDLQPITAADIEKNGLYGAGCSLVPSAQPGGDPVIMTNDRRAVFKVAGRLITFAADAGSEIIALGTRTHYVGRAQSLRLDTTSGDGTGLGQDAMRWGARVVVSDAHDQMIYSAAGELICTG